MYKDVYIAMFSYLLLPFPQESSGHPGAMNGAIQLYAHNNLVR